MNLEQKRELLIKWKESGLSLPKWWRRNADELNLPHLSTLYAWVKQLGFSTEPGVQENGEPEPVKTLDETGDSDDSPEEEEAGQTGDSQNSTEIEIYVGAEEDDTEHVDDSQGLTESEIDNKPEDDDVIAKDRIEQLAPSTVPEPAQPEKALDVDESKPGIKPQTWVIIGGAVVLGIGAYLLARKIIKRREQRPEQNTMPGGNPFAGYDGYITIDDF